MRISHRFLLGLMACALTIPPTMDAATPPAGNKKNIEKANKKKAALAAQHEAKAVECDKLAESATNEKNENLSAAYKEYSKYLRKLAETLTAKKADTAADPAVIEAEIKTAALKCLCFGGKVDYKPSPNESSNLSKYKDATMFAALASEKKETELSPLLDKQVIIFYKRIITDSHETKTLEKLKDEETLLVKEMIPLQKKSVMLKGQLIKLSTAEKSKLAESAYCRAVIPAEEIITTEKTAEKSDKKEPAKEPAKEPEKAEKKTEK